MLIVPECCCLYCLKKPRLRHKIHNYCSAVPHYYIPVWTPLCLDFGHGYKNWNLSALLIPESQKQSHLLTLGLHTCGHPRVLAFVHWNFYKKRTKVNKTEPFQGLICEISSHQPGFLLSSSASWTDFEHVIAICQTWGGSSGSSLYWGVMPSASAGAIRSSWNLTLVTLIGEAAGSFCSMICSFQS